MLRDNVSIGKKDPAKPSRRKRFFRAILKALEWTHFRSYGALYEDDLHPERLNHRARSSLPGAQLTEAQRKQIAEENERRARFH